MILNSSHLRGEKGASNLAAIAVVAAGYGGDMDWGTWGRVPVS